MADVRHVVTCGTQNQWEKKFKTCQKKSERAHRQADWQEHEVDLSVRKQNGASGKNAKDRARSADGRNVGSGMAEGDRNCLNQNFDETCTHSRQKIVANKARLAPDELKLAAEHPQHEHVE